MRILYGTTNPAKLASMRRAVRELPLEIVGLSDLHQPLPVIEERGNDPLENAEIKARAYYQAFSMPVFSCDSGLCFDGLERSQQPGTHVRRVRGRELSDGEMIAWYSKLAEEHGGCLRGRYRNAICLIVDGGHCFSSMDEALATEPFLLVSKAHPKQVPGFPLDALSVEPASGKYYYDLEAHCVESAMEQGFSAFFQRVLAALEHDTARIPGD